MLLENCIACINVYIFPNAQRKKMKRKKKFIVVNDIIGLTYHLSLVIGYQLYHHNSHPSIPSSLPLTPLLLAIIVQRLTRGSQVMSSNPQNV